jgi:hypothetical protein
LSQSRMAAQSAWVARFVEVLGTKIPHSLPGRLGWRRISQARMGCLNVAKLGLELLDLRVDA